MSTIKTHLTYTNIIQTLVAAGVVGILIQIGVYKERFDNLEKGLITLSSDFSFHVKENQSQFQIINNCLIEYTGKPVR
jgi:hypothetical protein